MPWRSEPSVDAGATECILDRIPRGTIRYYNTECVFGVMVHGKLAVSNNGQSETLAKEEVRLAAFRPCLLYTSDAADE